MKRVFSFLLTATLCLMLGISALAAQTGRLATATNNAIVVSNSSGDPDTHLVYPAAYKIDGSNYFKLRDVAMILNGSGKQFAVEYDSGSRSVAITSGKRYTPNGGELSGVAAAKNNAVFSNDPIIIDGKRVTLTAYKIDGANYFKLRDLGKVFIPNKSRIQTG